MILLEFDFPFDGPWGDEMAAAMDDLAADIAAEEGLVWKIWTENPTGGRAGGVYLFRDGGSADHYVAKHTERLRGFGIDRIEVIRSTVNGRLSAITRAPLGTDQGG